MVPPTNLLVFRDSSERVSGPSVALQLREALSRIEADRPASALVPLILAGEMESALSDAGCTSAIDAAGITDALAEGVLESSSFDPAYALSLLSAVERSIPDVLHISHPEGFAYYALHPLDFAVAAAGSVQEESVAVIGIRSIGTTLSAMVRSALVRKRLSASRITVRPVGHPYDRRIELTASQIAWFDKRKQEGSAFLIVDEGPGLSGSSFLSVAEALEQRGIPPSQIKLMGTRDVDPGSLCAHDAGQRWRRYHWHKAASTIAYMYSDYLPLSGGRWRGMLLKPGAEWPACWPEMESLKLFAPNGHSIVKFDGLGDHGERNRKRAEALFDAGFAPMPTESKTGMTSYEFVPGVQMSRIDLSTDVLDRIAEYCAFRTHSFRAEQQSDQLTHMLQFNLLQETGVKLDVPAGCFQSEAVIPDCRMHPHEWIRSSGGTLVKLDGNADGHGHFLPGPTDILWDLAGAIIEWNMSAAAEEYLLAQFQKRAGRISQARLWWFLLAYSVFRLAHSKMAHSSTQEVTEKPRLQDALLYYRRIIRSVLQRRSVNLISREFKV